jgi:hypothetical protein
LTGSPAGATLVVTRTISALIVRDHSCWSLSVEDP